MRVRRSCLRLNVDREIRIHSQLSHPNIVMLHTSFEDDEKIYLVMDKQPRDLFETLRERGRLDEEEVVMDVILPLLQALEYLHNQVWRFFFPDFAPDAASICTCYDESNWT